MQQSCTYGPVRGASGNRRPYRDKSTNSGESCNPRYAELRMRRSEYAHRHCKCLYLRAILPASPERRHTTPLPHAAPTGFAIRFLIRTRL